jgi:hypothetical protein
LAGSISDVNRIQRFLLLAVGAGLLACSSDSRNEPSPAQMCQHLVAECSGFKSESLNECQRVGERGLADESREDHCFVYYDTCIDQCRFYAEFGEGLDAGLEAGAGDGGLGLGDAGAPNAGVSDAAAASGPVPSEPVMPDASRADASSPPSVSDQ